MEGVGALCGRGAGLAVCPALGLVTTSDVDQNRVCVWSLEKAWDDEPSVAPVRLRLRVVLGKCRAHRIRFHFRGSASGYLAFLPSVPSSGSDGPGPLLLVTDFHLCAVHIVDVARRENVGYVAAPRSLPGASGVAASAASPLVAISTAWSRIWGGDNTVHLYQGSGLTWEPLCEVGSGLEMPRGVRFSKDGETICVADAGSNQASVFRVGDGRLVQHLATELRGPCDVEEVEAGWLVAGMIDTLPGQVVVALSGSSGVTSLPPLDRYSGGSACKRPVGAASLAVLPRVGLMVREQCNGGRLLLYENPDTVLMSAMSAPRVGWLVAVTRVLLRLQWAALRPAPF
jgi:hypothetical protein